MQMETLAEVLDGMRLQEDALTVLASGGCVGEEVGNALRLHASVVGRHRKMLRDAFQDELDGLSRAKEAG